MSHTRKGDTGSYCCKSEHFVSHLTPSSELFPGPMKHSAIIVAAYVLSNKCLTNVTMQDIRAGIAWMYKKKIVFF